MALDLEAEVLARTWVALGSLLLSGPHLGQLGLGIRLGKRSQVRAKRVPTLGSRSMATHRRRPKVGEATTSG